MAKRVLSKPVLGPMGKCRECGWCYGWHEKDCEGAFFLGKCRFVHGRSVFLNKPCECGKFVMKSVEER